MKRRTSFAPVKPVVGAKEKKTGPEPVRPWVSGKSVEGQHAIYRYYSRYKA